MLDSGHALVFVDNHDNQRGHGAGGNMLTFNSPHDYMLGQVGRLPHRLHRHLDPENPQPTVLSIKSGASQDTAAGVSPTASKSPLLIRFLFPLLFKLCLMFPHCL